MPAIRYFRQMRILLVTLILFATLAVSAQQNLYFVKMDQVSMDAKENRMMNPIAFFNMVSDTILSYNIENAEDAKPILIKKPEGYKTYAYGFVFFNGVPNPMSPGVIHLLLCDFKSQSPLLYIDRNNNNNFNDDGNPIALPGAYQLRDSAIFNLCRTDNADACISILLSRMNLINKSAYRDLLNEYYEFYYPGRKFIGIDFCFREQRLNQRMGVIRTPTDSFKLALMDVNSNGLYNEPGVDRYLIANLQDTFADSQNELQSFVIPEKAEDRFFEKNGTTYRIIKMDDAGKSITVIATDERNNTGIAAGKKVPKFKCYEWTGNKISIKQYKRKQVYIFLTSTKARDFSADTTALRAVMDKHGSRIQVIGFIDIDKSYELKIFGQYANLNWIAAYKNKYVIRDLQLRGMPASLLLGKKRKVMQYSISPQELLKKLDSE